MSKSQTIHDGPFDKDMLLEARKLLDEKIELSGWFKQHPCEIAVQERELAILLWFQDLTT